MKIIHCADLHLDSGMTANLSKEKAAERKNELLTTFNRLVDYAVEEQVDALIIAGDLFDTKRISALAKNTVYQAIVNHPELHVYYLRGNHDADSFLGSFTQLPPNLHLFEKTWTSHIANPKTAGNVVITGVELDRESSADVYASLFLERDRFNLVVLHGQDSAYGAKKDAAVINLRELKNKGIDYLALGHVHGYKEERLDTRGVYCYPGCLEGRGYDECGEHGFVLLTIDEQTRDCARRFIPFASRNLYEVRVDVSGCLTTFRMIECVEKALGEAGHSPRSMLKIILTGEVDVSCEKETELIRSRFEQEYYAVKVADETRFSVDYTAYYRDESLKGEFVRTVMNAEELSTEEKAEIIRYGIQALSGEEIR
jgi:DNA repair exonuclease SbcCD nuclease subunit